MHIKAPLYTNALLHVLALAFNRYIHFLLIHMYILYMYVYEALDFLFVHIRLIKFFFCVTCTNFAVARNFWHCNCYS